MKTFLAILFLSFTIASGAFAQNSANQCNPIGAANYDNCCITPTTAAIAGTCNAYRTSQQYCSDFPTDPQCTAPQTTPGECAPLTSSNYASCCPPALTDTARYLQCRNFKNATCAENPSDAICNPIRGGTRPINSSTTGSGDSTGNSPQAGSVEILSCSKTKIKSLFDILIWIKCVIAVAIIPLIFSLAFVVFLWGVFKFIASSDVKGKQEGQKVIWWGIIGLFVMVSVWGIIRILGTTLGVDTTYIPQLQEKK